MLGIIFFGFIGFPLLVLKTFFMLWVFFLAVMKLRDIRDAGALVGPIKYPAYAVLAVGYLQDAFGNLLLSFFVLERPQYTGGLANWRKWEWTVSDRTKRLALVGAWRGQLCQWLRTVFMAPADSSGAHN
jgi:hypothetical protein